MQKNFKWNKNHNFNWKFLLSFHPIPKWISNNSAANKDIYLGCFCWRVLSFMSIYSKNLSSLSLSVKLHSHMCIYRDKWISGLLCIVKVWLILVEIPLIYRHLFYESYIRWSINKGTKDINLHIYEGCELFVTFPEGGIEEDFLRHMGRINW